MAARTFQARIKICALFCVFPVLPITGRLFYIQIIKHENLSKIAISEFKGSVSQMGPRGSILDANGNILAQSIVTWNCYILKNQVQEPNRIFNEIPRILNISQKELIAKYNKSKNYVSIMQNLDREKYEKIDNLKIKGVILEPKQSRYYPSGNLARSVIGIASEDKGLTGIELIYDKLLRGSLSKREIIRDALGKTIYKNKGENGNSPFNIYLTLDKNIQFFAQEFLAKSVDKLQADLGIVIVQNPKTGQILAMATYPEDLEKVYPVEWVYEPGSTFKIFTLASALDKNIANPSDKFFCENGSWKYSDRWTIRDHKPEGILTLSEVIERSSNIGTAKLSLKIGIANLYSYMRSFGFGTKTELSFPGESSGLIRPFEHYKEIDLITNSYGHGIGVTPIQLINAVSAIGNGGYLMEPKIVEKIVNSDGKVVFANKPFKVRRVISERSALMVKDIMERAVESGTGKQSSMSLYRIAGKTGTSRKINEYGEYVSNKHVSSFCGFFPASDPQYSMLVILDYPKTSYYGSETAAPLFKEIAKKIIILKGIKPDKEKTAI